MEEKNADAVITPTPPKPIQKYSDLISALPLGCFGSNFAIRQFQGFWFPEPVLQGFFAVRDNFRPRPDDIFLASYPKSGTTWSKSLMFAAMTRKEYPPATAENHPLRTKNPHGCILCLEGIFAAGRNTEIEALPSPRLIATHIPYSLLRTAIAGSCRFVYVCRDPKDVLVSISNFPVGGLVMPSDPLAATFTPFCKGVIPYGPTWQHVLEFWRESQRMPEKILFLKYEEMTKDPGGNLKKLAEFMGCAFSPEEEKEGMVEDVVSLCSFKKLKELEVNKNGHQMQAFMIPNAAFFRKGEVGDWKNHMTLEMADMIDQIFHSKYQGSNLSFMTTTS